MSSLLQKVRRLVALAGSPATPEEEARTAAVQACRLLVEHDLKVVDAEGAGLDEESGATSQNYDDKDIFQRIRHDAVRKPSTTMKGTGPLKKMRAKRGSVCRVCGAPYLKGEEIAWRKGMNSGIHLRCSSLNATNGSQEGFKF